MRTSHLLVTRLSRCTCRTTGDALTSEQTSTTAEATTPTCDSRVPMKHTPRLAAGRRRRQHPAVHGHRRIALLRRGWWKTVPRRGFRFEAPLQDVTARPPPVAAPVPRGHGLLGRRSERADLGARLGPGQIITVWVRAASARPPSPAQCSRNGRLVRGPGLRSHGRRAGDCSGRRRWTAAAPRERVGGAQTRPGAAPAPPRAARHWASRTSRCGVLERALGHCGPLPRDREQLR